MTFRGENLVAGLAAPALLPVIGWRIRRGLRDGELVNPWKKYDNIPL